MPRIIKCECGHVARGRDDEELLAAVEAHIRQDHPELVGAYERRELLDMAEEVD